MDILPWHYRIVISSRHFAAYASLCDSVVVSGNCETRENCIKAIKLFPQPYRVNIWFDPYDNVEDGIVYPKLKGE